jgi:uncharacterized protein
MVRTQTENPFADSPIPVRAGVGLKARHYEEVLETGPDIGWFEVHPENYMGAGGPPHRYLTEIRRDYPLSLHGVGLSLGSSDPLDKEHLGRLRDLVERYQPGLVSEHVSWSIIDGTFFNDLLPLPYTEETLARLCDHISEMQDFLGRRILIENPSTYLRLHESSIPEAEFLVTAARRSGCGILLDVNNVYVSARNHEFDASAYLASVPGDLVGEIHLAGHHVDRVGDREIRIDDHGSAVIDAVWNLYADVVRRIGCVPTLIEWDNDVPEWDILLGEADKAEAVMADAAPGGMTHAA